MPPPSETRQLSVHAVATAELAAPSGCSTPDRVHQLAQHVHVRGVVGGGGPGGGVGGGVGGEVGGGVGVAGLQVIVVAFRTAW